MRPKMETIRDCELYCGDCLELLPQLAGRNLDCLITDPPYGCTHCEWDHDVDLDAFWQTARPACKPDAPYLLFCQMPFAARLYASNPKMFRYEWIYKKYRATGFLDARRKPMRGHETIYVFYETLPKYRPQKSPGTPYVRKESRLNTQCYKASWTPAIINSGHRYPTSIIDLKPEAGFFAATGFSRHPTQKPVTVLSYLVKTYTDEQDFILDPFMGSGSTGVAAVQTGRRFIGIEREPHWFDVACQRIEAAYQELALLKDVANA